jgi:hypothetical protein
MSFYPDSILSKGGFKTSRDCRETNIRLKCPFCPRDNLLFTSYGPHILKTHFDSLFVQDSKSCQINRTRLQRTSCLSTPLDLDVGEEDDQYACLGCLSLFRRNATAVNHFKKKKAVCGERHKEMVLMLRNKYPVSFQPPVEIKNKHKLELFLDDVLERLRKAEKVMNQTPWDYEETYGAYFPDWGMDLREETLKENWDLFNEPPPPSPPPPPPAPEPVPEPEQPKTPPSEPAEDELLPLVEEKPLTREEVMKMMMSEEEQKEFLFFHQQEEQKKRERHMVNPAFRNPIPTPAPPPPPPTYKIIQNSKLKRPVKQVS